MTLEAICEWLAVLFFAMAGVAMLRKPPAKKKPAPGFLDRELDVLPGIPFTGKMATEGIYVIAELGWGKTWLTFMRSLQAYIPVMGGVILGMKGEDGPEVEKRFAEAGASHRLAMFGPRYGTCLNWLQALMSIAPKGCETEEVIGGLASLVEVEQRSAAKSGDEGSHFFKTMAMFLLSAMVTMLRLANESLSAAALYRFLTSLPGTPAQLESEQWLKTSYANACMEKAHYAAKNQADGADYETAKNFLLGELLNLNDRTKTSITSTVSGMLSKMLRPWLQALYGSTSNVRIQDVFEGRWFYIDTSPIEFGEYGTYSLIMFKHLIQRAIMRRRVDKHSLPVALMFDEAQTVFVTADRDYQAVCRSKLGCTWAATQNLTGLYAVLGGGQAAEAQAKSWLALFGCKIFGANTDWLCNTYASEMCGQHREWMMSTNSNERGDATVFDTLIAQRGLSSPGGSEQYQPLVRPETFVRLRKPEPPTYEADAIVVLPRLQQLIGRHWAEVTFRPDR